MTNPTSTSKMLPDSVVPRSGDETSLMREQFTAAYPFPHICIDNFLNPDLAEALIEDFPSSQDADYARHCVGDDGKVGPNYANGEREKFPAAFQKLDQLCADPAFLKYLGEITGIDGLEYDPDYFGGGIRESREGVALPVHIDFNHHPRTLHHRRLNLLVYLNKDWDPRWGGNIQVHLNPNKFGEKSLVGSYAPIFNRAFIFETSETSWHGFDNLKLPDNFTRRAWTVYFYTKTRPGEEDIPLRNTEYVEPPLVDHFRPGYTLTKQDVEYLQRILGRRDGRIAMLYQMRRGMDSKYSHLWQEYEYYLELSRKLQAQLEGAG